jgi:hypothetical protein
VGSRSLLLVPERAEALAGQQGGAQVWVLPRRAEAARRVLEAASPSLSLASLVAAEWQAAPWRELRQEQEQLGGSMVSTAQGAIHVRIAPSSPTAVKQGGWWQPGIWSASRSDAQCRR